QYGDYVYMPIPPVLSENPVSNPPLPPFSKGGIKEVPPLKKGDKGGFSHSHGVCHPPAILPELFNIMETINNNKAVSRIENIDESWIDPFVSAGFKIKSGESEYLYLREDLSKLKGDSYKSKRAMYNYFKKHYRYSYEPFEPSHAPQCIELYNSWKKEKEQKVNDSFYNAVLEDSYPAHREAINNYESLGLTGRVVKIDNRLCGYIFGFERNKDIFYILLEVTNPGIKGLAQFIFREICMEMEGYTYINVLGDSGLENLRKVKLSYRPLRLAPAFTAYRN
ncbi:MAG: phosphatidylglycerol lysyltransferase domain-containing protein, partial [Nitrospirota bacterium]